MRQTIRLTESELRRMISKNIKKFLNEDFYHGNGNPFPIDPSDLAEQLYNSGCDFYMFVHRLEKTYEMIKHDRDTDSEKIDAKSKKDFLNIGEIQNNTVFIISIHQETTPQELDVLVKISEKYQQNIEYDYWNTFYVYDKDALYNFIKDMKNLNIGREIYIYKGDEPDYDWELIGKITI